MSGGAVAVTICVSVALQRQRADVEERRRPDDRRHLPALEVLDLREPGVLARDDRAQHGRRDAGHLERHAVLERLRRQREAHVDRVHVLRRELREQGTRRAGHDRVLGLPAVLREQVFLVDDLGAGPAELEVRQLHAAFALRARDGGRTDDRGRGAGEKLATADHALTCGTPRSASAIFSAGYA
jgi:hypothetical protein